MSLSGIPRWSELTAIFGGTFDPPHQGHREAVDGLFRNPGVGRVIVIPSAAPPHKPSVASPEQRLAMAKLAFTEGKTGALEVDGSELERAARTGRPSYSYETLQEFGRQHKEVAFVVGADQLRDLPGWYRFPEILGLCHWIALARRPDGEKIARAALSDWEASGLAVREKDSLWKLRPSGSQLRFLTLVSTDAPELSSTSIREELGRTGQPPRDTLPAAVSGYLKHHGLYGTQKDPL